MRETTRTTTKEGTLGPTLSLTPECPGWTPPIAASAARQIESANTERATPSRCLKTQERSRLSAEEEPMQVASPMASRQSLTKRMIWMIVSITETEEDQMLRWQCRICRRHNRLSASWIKLKAISQRQKRKLMDWTSLLLSLTSRRKHSIPATKSSIRVSALRIRTLTLRRWPRD